MSNFRIRFGRRLADVLEAPTARYHAFDATPATRLRATLRPGDVLLVEGDSRVATAIKYLTTSTWSHAAFFVGGPPETELIEADLRSGVHRVGLDAHEHLNTRICRPVGLDGMSRERVVEHMVAAIGQTYDLKNIVDLARYLLPQPPIPRRFRRRMLALGSGDPTRAICSTLIAEAFQTVRYPILPEPVDGDAREAIYRIRHHSLFVPRDFDLSPFFRIVKPTIETGFDFRAMNWAEGETETGSLPAPPD